MKKEKVTCDRCKKDCSDSCFNVSFDLIKKYPVVEDRLSFSLELCLDCTKIIEKQIKMGAI